MDTWHRGRVEMVGGEWGTEGGGLGELSVR